MSILRLRRRALAKVLRVLSRSRFRSGVRWKERRVLCPCCCCCCVGPSSGDGFRLRDREVRSVVHRRRMRVRSGRGGGRGGARAASAGDFVRRFLGINWYAATRAKRLTARARVISARSTHSETCYKHSRTPSTMPTTVLMARDLERSPMGSTLLRTAMTKIGPATVNRAASLHRHMQRGRIFVRV